MFKEEIDVVDLQHDIQKRLKLEKCGIYETAKLAHVLMDK